jgi:choline dehydrogenase-like flavoprotein
VSHAEHRTTLELTSTARELLGDLGLGTVREFDWLSSLEGYRAHVLDTYHHAGTTRMAEDPAAGVVDPNCQVHGVSGLFVAGGSAFPTSAYANPTLTVVAMSLRLADHLAASL